MKKYLLLAAVLIFAVSCQSSFKVGSSNVSIEPTDETLSLSLAGFAAPYEGRFTLGWKEFGETENLIGFTVSGEKFYGLDREGKVVSFAPASVETVKRVHSNLKIKFLAGNSNRLFGVTPAGELFSAKPESGNLEWEKLSLCPNIKAIAASEEHLYTVDGEGFLNMGTVDDGNILWSRIMPVGDIISIATDGARLYALDSEGVLHQAVLQFPKESWMRIGYNNGETYTIDPEHIALSDGKLFAYIEGGKLYSNIHNSEGELSARAISFQKGKNIAVVVALDLCGFDYSFIESVKEEIYQKTGIPAEAVMINASHCHFTPVTQSWITWEKYLHHPDTLYLNNIVKPGIVLSVEKALKNAKQCDLYFGRGETNIGYNRRKIENYNVYDNSLDLIKIVPKDGSEESLLFLTGCHPVFAINRFVASPNFPGYARKMVESSKNIETSLFIQGCAGDINPRAGNFQETGEELGNDIISTLDQPMELLKGKISSHFDKISIPATPITRGEVEKLLVEAEKDPESGVSRRDVRWANLMLNKYEKQGSPEADMPVYVQTLNIGDWKLVALSREATSEYSLAIKELWPDKKVSVAGYTNDVASYLPTDPHIKTGSYEGYGSFFWYGQPNNYPIGTFDKIVNHIKENNR